MIYYNDITQYLNIDVLYIFWKNDTIISQPQVEKAGEKHANRDYKETCK